MKYVWDKNRSDEKNQTLLFFLELHDCGGQKINGVFSASGAYKLYVNEELGSYGPTRAPKGYVREDAFAFTAYEDRVRIAVIVRHCGVATYDRVKQQPFFAAEIRTPRGTYTAADFSAYDFSVCVREVERFSFQRGFAEWFIQEKDLREYLLSPAKYFAPVDCVQVPPRKVLAKRVPASEIRKENTVSCLQSGTAEYTQAKPLWHDRAIDNVGEHIGGFVRSELRECLIDYLSRLSYTAESGIKTLLGGGEYAVYALGRNVSGFLGLTVTVYEQTEIYVLFDEFLNKDGRVDFSRSYCSSVVKWTLQKGEYTLETLEPYTLKFAQITVRTGRIGVHDVHVTLVQNDAAYGLHFDTADTDVLTVVRAAQNTLAQNAVDLFIDCPSRERAGWINDVYFTRKAAEILIGNFDVEKNTLENYALCGQLPELPEGMVPMCYPADHPNGEYIPNCALWYARIVCEYILKTGDAAFARIARAQIYAILDFFAQYENEYGLLENLDGWIFVDWSAANDREYVKGVNFPTNMQYGNVLEIAGDTFGDVQLREKAENCRKNITALSYNGRFFEDNRIRKDGVLQPTGHCSEACQYYAFAFGIADPTTYPELYATLKDYFVPSRNEATVFPSVAKSQLLTGLLLRETVLLDWGEREQAVSEVKEIFLKMAQDTNTLWEFTDNRFSGNHGCASYAAYLLVRAYTGFRGFYRGEAQFDDGYLPRDSSTALHTPWGELQITVRGGKRCCKLQ